MGINNNYITNKQKLFMVILICTVISLSFYCVRINNIVDYYKEKYNNECFQAMQIIKSTQSMATNSNEFKIKNDKLTKQNNELIKKNEQMKKEIESLKNKNNKLETSKKELAGDNLELQKSLKKAAAAGITPQSFNSYNSNYLETNGKKGEYLGRFLGTAYTPSTEECGNSRGITSSGQPIIPGISIAIDRKHWPYGTVFYIKGLGYTVAMDTGSAIKGKNRFDFAVFDKDFAKQLGQQYYDVYLVKIGNGKIDRSIME